jgi:hypothetical protein
MNQAQAGTVPQSDAPGGTRVSVTALALANLLPLGLVAAGVWDVAGVVFFFWFENLIIGFYNLLRIATARQLAIGERLGLGSFFTVHYGIFCMGHMVFLVEVFGFPGLQPGQPVPGGGFALFDVIATPELLFPPHLWWPLIALALSHGLSFVTHYVLGGERLTVNQGTLMGRPYGRIVVMHVWLFVGGFLIMHWNAPMAGLLALVLLKTAIDAGSHAYLHRPRRRAQVQRRSR